MGKTHIEDLIAKPSRREAKRAVRARHKDRMRKRLKTFMPDLSDHNVHRMADNICVCSNPWCCGNPRALEGDSLSDRRKKSAFAFDLDD